MLRIWEFLWGHAQPARGVFLKHGRSCHFSLSTCLVIMPSEQILKPLANVVKCLHDQRWTHNFRCFCHSSPICVSYASQVHTSCAEKTTTQSVHFHNWLTPFPLPEMSSSLFLTFSFWQRPTHILWAGSKTKVSKRPSQILPGIQGSEHAYSSVPAIGCSPWWFG